MPNSPAPEPWRGPSQIESHRNDRSRGRASFYDANRMLVGFTIIREVEKDGSKHNWSYGAKRRRDRIVACVNTCQGIPDDMLSREGILALAIQLMRRACDFGDLHLQTLPDRIAANMTDLYYGTILNKERISHEQ